MRLQGKFDAIKLVIEHPMTVVEGTSLKQETKEKYSLRHLLRQENMSPLETKRDVYNLKAKKEDASTANRRD